MSEATDLARKVAEIANRDVSLKIRETKGPNDDGPKGRIRQYQAAAGIKPPSPYCAAAICCWIKEAAAELGTGYQNLLSPSAVRLLEYARRTGHAKEPAELTVSDLPAVGV